MTAKLHANTPNPFTEQTKIRYYIPEGTTKATLYIYNMNGHQIKSYLLNKKGTGSIAIAENTLEPGMYMYTLITDGTEVDTKRMILTE